VSRMGWAIVIATALHGAAILGVGFVPGSPESPEDIPTLEVTLLESPDPDEPIPDNARYLAQASQQGAGNVAEDVRPELHQRPPAPEAPEAMLRGLQLDFSAERPGGPAAERVAAARAPLRAAAAPEAGEAEARPMEVPPPGGVTRVTLAGEREHFVSVNTRESVFAEYLAAWKARMERLGTLNFPADALRGRSGNPVLEVALAADGSLREVRVTRSSGHSPLDRAAVDLVRLASPFDPFPPQIRREFDVLRFAYEWRFIEGRQAGSTLRARPD
jgi:periplasmic protein TonB